MFKSAGYVGRNWSPNTDILGNDDYCTDASMPDVGVKEDRWMRHNFLPSSYHSHSLFSCDYEVGALEPPSDSLHCEMGVLKYDQAREAAVTPTRLHCGS